MMNFTREELLTIHQALFVAERYYQDPDRKVKGMVPPDDKTVTERLSKIGRVLDQIDGFAESLS